MPAVLRAEVDDQDLVGERRVGRLGRVYRGVHFVDQGLGLVCLAQRLAGEQQLPVPWRFLVRVFVGLDDGRRDLGEPIVGRLVDGLVNGQDDVGLGGGDGLVS